MKQIILMIMIFTSVAFSQSSKLLLLMGDDSWNPTKVDGNTLAYYNGNLGLTASLWEDQFSNNDIVFYNEPTINSGTGIVKAVRFNGSNEYGIVATPTLTKPYTVYLVLKSIAWGSNDWILNSQSGANAGGILQGGSTPNLQAYSGAALNSDPDLPVGTYGIITVVFNGASSEIRINLNNSVTGTTGVLNGNGITIGALPTPSNYCQVEIAYLLIRSGADNTAKQNLIIQNLANICGLSL